MAYNYIPKYIRQSENKSPKGVVTASRWNELFNLLIQQGDHTAEELGNILNYFSTSLVGVESEIAESAEAIANIREAFRINVTSSNGVYTADKTFDEIKTAYDAGQLPYVVLTGDTLDFVYTLAYFSVPNVTGQGFVAFERYLIGEDTLETETLRIYSYTTASGSNIVKRTSSFDVSCGNGVVSFVDEEGGASIAQFTLNQTEDCEINVNTLTTRLGTKVNNLETSLSNNYRTSAEQDVIDSTKLTDAPTDGKEYARKNGSWQEVIGGGGTSDHSQLTNRDAANQHPITAITGLQTALDGKADVADIPSLEGYATEAYVQNYHDNTKQDIINDLVTIRSGASKGATAVQPEAGKGLFSGSYNDLTDKPEIPDAVTEGTVSGWGFTKNTGTYSKPTDGIPKSDLANDVQASLGKANTALQHVPSAYRTAVLQDKIDSGKVDKVDGKGLSTNDYTDAAKAKVDAIPENPQYTDTVFSGNYNDLTNKPTIPTVPQNISAFTNDSGYLTLATLPKYGGESE